MANFYLDTNGISELGQSSTAVRVNGTAGDKDQILLLANAANVVVGPAVEIIDFAGSVADYQFVTSADGGIAVYRGATLVANVGLNPNTSELRFAEGGLTLDQDPETGAITVGGQEVSGERAEYTGDGMLTGKEHQSQAGGNGPSGPGETYTLPADLGAGNIIQSEGGNDTYNTDMNGLRPNAQIVDSSTTDRDVLNLLYNTKNANGQIVNVETINAKWDGISDGQFDAGKVTSAAQGGTNIVVSTTRSTAKNFVVSDVKANTVTAGDGVTGNLEIQGVKGGVVEMGGASGLILTNPAGAATVKAEKDFSLNANGATFAKNKALTIESDQDITISSAGTGIGNGSYVQAAGKGAITLSTGLDGTASKGDISNMTGFAAIGVNAANAATNYTVADGQTVLFTTQGGATTTATFNAAGKAKDAQLGMIAGERDLGKLSISGSEVSNLTIDVNNQNIVIADLIGDGGTSSLTQEPGKDVFTLVGKGNATIAAVSSGGTVDASGLEGKLVMGKNAAIPVGGAEEGLAVAAGSEGSEIFIGNVGVDDAGDNGLFFMAGGAGNDSLTLSGVIAVSNNLNKASVTAILGDGDDTVTFAAGCKVSTSGAGSVAIDFGAGRDTIKVDANADVDLTNGGAVRLSGFEALEIGEKGTFKVKASSLDANPSFEILSDGLTIVHDKGGDLDLSGLKAGAEATRPVMTVEITNSDAAAPGTVTLGSLSERVLIKSASATLPAEASSIVTLKGFTANGVDTFAFHDKAGAVTSRQNIHTNSQGALDNGIFADAELSGSTLMARLDDLAKKLTNPGDFAFYTDGTDTYVLANGDAADGKIQVVRLEGTAYTAAALSASMGFEHDGGAKTTLVTSVDGYVLAVDPVDTPTPFNFIVDKAADATITIQGGSGADTLVISDNIAASGSVTTVSDNGNGGTVNPGDMGSGADSVTIDKITIASGGSLVVNTGAEADTVNISAGIGLVSGSTLDLNGGADTDTLNITGATLNLSTAGVNASLKGFEAVNGSLKFGGTNLFLKDDGTAADADSITLNGSLEFALTANDSVLNVEAFKAGNTSGDTASITIDAATATITKALDITLSKKGVSATSHNIAETVKINKVDAGADSVNAAVIRNFDVYEDKIDITKLNLTGSVLIASGGTTISGSIAETLAATKDTPLQDDASNALAADAKVAVVLNATTDSYLVFGTMTNTAGQFDTSAAYEVIKLVGVTAATLTPTVISSCFVDSDVTFSTTNP